MDIQNTKTTRASPTTKRMTIQLTKELAEGLEWLAEDLGISQVEALRRAIGTEIYLRQELKDGGRLFIKKESEIKEVVLLR